MTLQNFLPKVGVVSAKFSLDLQDFGTSAQILCGERLCGSFSYQIFYLFPFCLLFLFPFPLICDLTDTGPPEVDLLRAKIL